MSDIIETLQNTTRLVKMWGRVSPLRRAHTIEALTLNGIPFWDAFAVDLARIYVPAALSADAALSDIYSDDEAILDSCQIRFSKF